MLQLDPVHVWVVEFERIRRDISICIRLVGRDRLIHGTGPKIRKRNDLAHGKKSSDGTGHIGPSAGQCNFGPPGVLTDSENFRIAP